MGKLKLDIFLRNIRHRFLILEPTRCNDVSKPRFNRHNLISFLFLLLSEQIHSIILFTLILISQLPLRLNLLLNLSLLFLIKRELPLKRSKISSSSRYQVWALRVEPYFSHMCTVAVVLLEIGFRLWAGVSEKFNESEVISGGLNFMLGVSVNSVDV